jgi:PAS domain S-box-containing protein
MATDVRQAEKRLAAQVSFLQVLMEDVPVPVFYKNVEGRMLGCNSAFAEFWGKRVDEIIGRTPEELYPPAEAALHRAMDEETLRSEHPLAYERVVASADGRPHDIAFHKAPFRDEEGQVAGVIGVMHDVTLQREAIRMKSEFVSTVAHEFQTPLATILGFSELLHDGSLDEGQRQDALQRIIRKTEALSQMVDELLDLARLESGRPLTIDKAPCDVNRLLSDTVDGFRSRVATHHFVLELAAETLVIPAEAKRLAQVVENLLSNAVKYSAAGSTVHVSTQCSDGRGIIAVRDQGVGMSPDQLEHVFDKFYRANAADTAPAGTGLGLFICRSIVEGHGGEIRIFSAPGQGTTVTVSLPLGGVA